MKQNLLEQAGLNKNEANVYQIVLEHGEIAPPKVAEISDLTRQNAYAILKSLVQKELIEEIERKKKLAYRPLAPQALVEYAERKTKEAEMAEKALHSALPELQSLFNLATNKPGVTYFEGIDGIKKIFSDIYSAGKEVVYGVANIESIDKSFSGTLAKLIPLRVKNNLKSVAFINESTVSRLLKNNDKKQLRETHLVSNEEYPFPAEIDIYENKIAMLDFTKGKFVGIIIENKAMATSLESLFRIALDSRRARKQ